MLHKSSRPAIGNKRNGNHVALRSNDVLRWTSMLPALASMLDTRASPHPSASMPIALRQPEPEVECPTGTLRTFIVDDSMLIQGALTTALEDMAPVTVVGHAAEEAAAADWLAAHAGDCDLIVLDIWLRTGNGLGLLEREVFRAFQGKCVVFTNHASPELEKSCRMLGADALFSKADGFHQLLSYCAELAKDEFEKDGARYAIRPFFNA